LSQERCPKTVGLGETYSQRLVRIRIENLDVNIKLLSASGFA
jgi:hypothetical protein